MFLVCEHTGSTFEGPLGLARNCVSIKMCLVKCLVGRTLSVSEFVTVKLYTTQPSIISRWVKAFLTGKLCTPMPIHIGILIGAGNWCGLLPLLSGLNSSTHISVSSAISMSLANIFTFKHRSRYCCQILLRISFFECWHYRLRWYQLSLEIVIQIPLLLLFVLYYGRHILSPVRYGWVQAHWTRRLHTVVRLRFIDNDLLTIKWA